MVIIAQVNGHDIHIEADGIFRTEVDNIPYLDRTLSALKEKLAGIEQKRVKNRKLSLPVVVYGEKGAVVACTITGVNLHTNEVTGLGKQPPDDIWVDEPWIIDRLVKRLECKAQLKALDEELHPFRIGRRVQAPGGGDYRGVTPQNYGDALDALEKAYQEKHAAAEKRRVLELLELVR